MPRPSSHQRKDEHWCPNLKFKLFCKTLSFKIQFQCFWENRSFTKRCDLQKFENGFLTKRLIWKVWKSQFVLASVEMTRFGVEISCPRLNVHIYSWWCCWLLTNFDLHNLIQIRWLFYGAFSLCSYRASHKPLRQNSKMGFKVIGFRPDRHGNIARWSACRFRISRL